MVQDLRFDGQTVVVTGAGHGLGKEYALFLASRGANIVVNDLGGSFKGEGASTKVADEVVDEIIAAGGKAVANYDSVVDGEKIIQTALDTFGRIDVLINNAGILRDVSLKNMKDSDWDLITDVHVTGPFKCTRAAWPHFRKQKYGRVINTTSAAGLFGNIGQCNYSAAKLAQVGFTQTLAQEGVKYNILTNVIAPVAASRMTATVIPQEGLAKILPEWVVPLVAVLTHQSSTENGSIFEVGGGNIAKLRWQRSSGLLLRPDKCFTPSAILSRWAEVNDFSKPEYPNAAVDMLAKLESAKKLAESPKGPEIRFDGKVALITGGGTGLGRAYALAFAKLGAKIVVNDLINPDVVVKEIQSLGGHAVGNEASVEDGEAVVKAAIDAYGKVDILINNAGILRDKAFANMTTEQWHEVVNVHLKGTYKVTKAAYPYMVKQKYGRIINTTSTTGIYGNFGQSNYAAAAAGIIGFSQSLALEGRRNNIFVNTIAPNAGTALTRTVLPERLVEAFKPEFVAPLVLLLCSDQVPDPPTGLLYEVGSGWQGRTRWQRSGGHIFPLDVKLNPEAVIGQWPKIVDFNDGRATNPDNILANAGNPSGLPTKNSRSKDYLGTIQIAKNRAPKGSEFSYDDKDVLLYNLSLNAKRAQLPLVYEKNSDFQVLPSYGVIPQFYATSDYSLDDVVPNFSPTRILHGEQYLEIRKFPIPTAAKVVTYPRLLEVVDKGKAALIAQGYETKDAATGEGLFYNQSILFLRGCGGFGGVKNDIDRGAASTVYTLPDRAPDAVAEEQTTLEQAAIYRLNGDRLGLHIDPEFSKVAGFEYPILHGLCTFGFSAKHILQTYGQFKNIKVRFSGTVIPGETLVTEMWKEGNKVIFQTKVKETGTVCLANSGAELRGGPVLKL